MPVAANHGGSLISTLRWLKTKCESDEETIKSVNSIMEAIIKTFKMEGEHIADDL